MGRADWTGYLNVEPNGQRKGISNVNASLAVYVEYPYDHKEIRLLCIEWMISMFPQIRQIFSNYHIKGGPNNLKDEKVQPTPECSIKPVKSTQVQTTLLQKETNHACCCLTVLNVLVLVVTLMVSGFVAVAYCSTSNVETSEEDLISLEKTEVMLSVDLSQKFESFLISSLTSDELALMEKTMLIASILIAIGLLTVNICFVNSYRYCR